METLTKRNTPPPPKKLTNKNNIWIKTLPKMVCSKLCKAKSSNHFNITVCNYKKGTTRPSQRDDIKNTISRLMQLEPFLYLTW